MRPQKFEYFDLQIPNTQLLNGINIMYYKDIDYGKMLLHSHDFIEIILVMEGNISISHEGILYNMNPGDISIVSDGLFHNTIIHDNSKQYERFVLHIDKNLFEEFNRAHTNLSLNQENMHIPIVFNCNAEDTFYLRFILNQLYYNNYIQDEFSQNIIFNSIYDLLVFCERKFRTPKLLRPKISNQLVSDVIEYINENFTSPWIKTQDIAASFFISEGYLSKLFRKFTGTTVYNYILEKRLSYARQLISSGIQIQEASYCSGFSDYTSFLKAFKKKYDTTPTEFKENKNNLIF